MTLMDEYADAIRTQVCVACLDRTGRGVCGTEGWDRCPLNRYLDQIVALVNRQEGVALQDLVHGMKSTVCADCRVNPQAFCRCGREDECALEQYFPLVIEAIRTVNLRHARK